MPQKTVLIVGGGGREHALAWKIAQSPSVTQVLVAPGNGGTAREPKVRNVAVAANDIEGLAVLAQECGAALTVVGPEAPLAAGIKDRFQALGLPCLGPNRTAAELESSKAFAKAFLKRHGIPTAEYGVFTQAEEAERYIRGRGAPLVVKADGLAAGKGVVLAADADEAVAAVRDMLCGQIFGEAGARVVVEDFLEGEEASFIALVDGEQVLALASSQDHKAAWDGDMGPNTGGMGAYSPAPVVTDPVYRRIMQEIMLPTVRGMAAEGRSFCGFLYAGLMVDRTGNPHVLEFNVRLGDPETQPLLMRLKSDLVELFEAALTGRLDQAQAEWDERPALGVVMTAAGYPGTYRKGDEIHGLECDYGKDVKVFHAGTRIDADGRLVTAGGRVLCVCALGQDIRAAQARAYTAVDHINWEGRHFRTDIGHRAISRLAPAPTSPP